MSSGFITRSHNNLRENTTLITRASVGNSEESPSQKMQTVLCRQKGEHSPRRSMRRPVAETGEDNATSLARDRMRCFGKRGLASIAPNTFISHTKMSIFSRKGRFSIELYS